MHVVQKSLERYLLPDARQMVHELTEATGPGFRKLNDAVSCMSSMLLSVILAVHINVAGIPFNAAG